MKDPDPRLSLTYQRMGFTSGQPRSRPSRKWSRLWLLFTAITLSLWGLWHSGVIFKEVSPIPSTRVEAILGTNAWSLPGRDTAHSSYLPVNSRVEGNISWRFETGATLPFAPAVAQGKVFLTTGDNRFVALEERTGTLLWERGLPAVMSGSPALTVDMVYLALRDGKVVALDSLNGSIKWVFQSPDLFSAPAVVYRGVVYAGSWGGTIYALDALSGLELWTSQTQGKIVAAPAFAENLMSIAIDNRLIYIIDTLDAGKRLIYDAGFTVLESPVFTDGLVLVSTAKGRIAAIDASKIEYPLERGFRYWRKQFFLWGLQEQPPIPKGHVWGRKLTGNSALSAAAVAEEVAFVASTDGRVYALNVNDGDLLWAYDAGVAIRTSITMDSDHVYVGTDKGDVLALSVTDGTLQQRIQLGLPLRGSIVVTKDALYVTSQSPSVLFAVR